MKQRRRINYSAAQRLRYGIAGRPTKTLWRLQQKREMVRRLPGDPPWLEAWRRDYNEAQPHSKLSWLTPEAYARALTAQIGRSAAPVNGSAGRPLANPTNLGSDQPRTLVMAG